jgi:UDP-GlcNAc:undecaprenyl-phosphate GlcNAc-1-phosphate transferase
LGGIGIAFSWLIAITIWYLFQGRDLVVPESFSLFIVGALSIFVIGLIDDFRNLPASLKLLAQIISATMISFSGFNIPGLWVPGTELFVNFGFLSPFFMIFWIISITNAINLIDGMDWMAGSISLIGALSIAAMHWIGNNVTGVVLSLALVGAIAGFLVYNRPKAKIFMGDGGAYFLGAVLATLPFIPSGSSGSSYQLLQTLRLDQTPSILEIAARVPDGLMVVLCLLIPVADMVAAILRRYRRHLPFHAPDREHVHHKLLDFGLSVPRVLGVTIPVSLGFGAAAILVYYFWSTGHTLLAGLIEISSYGIAVVLFSVLHTKNKRRKAQEY